MSARLVFSVVVLALLAGGLWWTASLGGGDDDHGPITAAFTISVVGPDGSLVANGTVMARGTPLDVLQGLGEDQGFDVEVEQQPWIGGGCTAAYVVAIAGHGETTTGGWNYYTRHAGEDWTWRAAGAACHRLSQGEQVEWCWVESDVCRHHVA